MYYDQNGQPIALLEWAALFEKTRERIIGHTTLKGPARSTKWVSTVWLGLDHNFGTGTPLIFETMVFERGSYRELACQRYATRAEADAGHQALCQTWQYNHRQRRSTGTEVNGQVRTTQRGVVGCSTTKSMTD